MDHTMLARVIMKQAEIFAAYAEIEAMKALNQSRISNNESLAYTESAFNDVVNTLNNIASELHSMIY